MRQKIFALMLIVGLIVLWEYYSRHNLNLIFILPIPSRVLLCLWECSDRLLIHSIATFKEMGGGFLLALSIAFPLAWSMYLWHSLRMVLQPFFIIIQCIPMFTLAPIMVFWFDWSYMAIVIPTALMIFFPLTMNIYQGLKSTPKNLLDYFKVNNASNWQIFSKLQLPWSVPHITSGLRVAAAIAGIGAVAGEWAGAQQGLGVLMLESRRGTDLELTFAALFCLFFISFSFYASTLLIEKLAFRRAKRPNYKMPLKVAASFTPLLLLMLLMGCNSSSPQTENLKTTHLILDWLPNPNHVPLYVGIEKGIFKKYGIDLQITKIADPGDTVSFLTSERVDLALYYMPETYLAISQGAPLQVVGLLIKEPLNVFIFRKGEGIAAPSNLTDKRLGYVVGGFGLTFLNRLLDLNSIHPSEKFNVSFDLVSTLGAKRVDVIYGAYWNIESEHLRSLGVETDYFSLDQLGHPTYYELLIVAKKGTSFSEPSFVEHFKIALQESIEIAKADPDIAFDCYLKNNLDKRAKTCAWERAAWLKTISLLAKDQINDQSVWDEFDRWIKENSNYANAF